MQLTVLPGKMALIQCRDYRLFEGDAFDDYDMKGTHDFWLPRGGCMKHAYDLITILNWDPGQSPDMYSWSGCVRGKEGSTKDALTFLDAVAG